MTDEKEVELTVRFGGEQSELRVDTLISSLAGISEVIDQLNSEIGDGQHLEIRIKAVERGSFEVFLCIIPPALLDLIDTVDWETTSKIVGTLVGILTIKKLLRGEEPKSVVKKDDSVVVTAKSGSRVSVDKRTFNIYSSNGDIQKTISRVFGEIESDASIDSFQIESDSDQVAFDAQREDFDGLAATEVITSTSEQTKTETKRVTLHILKIVWDSKRKWEFLFEGRKISAFIKDQEFFQRIEAGSEKFSKGDTLSVDMEITKIFDPAVELFVEDGYEVTKVIDHTPRHVQGEL